MQKGTVGHEVRGATSRNGGRAVVDCTDLDNWLIYDTRTGKETLRVLPVEQERPTLLTENAGMETLL
ncbi:hypothetical protein AB0N06_16250 [Streptomyces sp. NPDC051020]|uniref:hypothetical protein n=1 Tax=Streptomyces sp. NPDC051020 TaxID=3155409 RepID=UPI003442E2C3